VAAGAAAALSLPDSAVARSGNQTHVWKLQGERLQKAAVQLGPRDTRSGDWPVVSGVAVGELLLRHPSQTLADGQKVERKAVTKPVALSAPAAASAAR
jgi:membrane fusion protein, multidrug efflux system